jgi:DtxR family transcriptional regulator, Mn-dependent transcriptional regulator
MSISTEEYLEALYSLTRDNEPASTSAISRRLNIAAASVTEMMHKLANEGYVHYSPYQGVTLTVKGYRIAEKMTRKHRLLERFLHDVLKIGKDKVHTEACKMEHALSDETARAMCQLIKSPCRCPDDDQLIPPCDLGFSNCEECRKWGQDNPEKISKRKTIVAPVDTLKEDQEGTISFIRGGSKLLRSLLDMGLTPGTKVRMSRAAPPDGPPEIICRGTRLSLKDEIAHNVFIEKAAVKPSGHKTILTGAKD